MLTAGFVHFSFEALNENFKTKFNGHSLKTNILPQPNLIIFESSLANCRDVCRFL